jgi:protein-L-isoaspartate(D-aspartate) O-methyltransferase
VSDLQRDWTGNVDRRQFIPDVIYIQREPLADFTAVSREDEPELWEQQVSSDDPVITKLNPIVLPDGSSKLFWAASSSSAPAIMNQMISELRLEPGLSVLEIGTGTGWNAAVMAHAGAIVTTVEVDAEIAQRARAALDKAGYSHVFVIAGDGELGAPERAPFDRVIATAAVTNVPYSWVSQVKDGGLIVFPYTGRYCSHGLAVITARAGIAVGEIRAEGRAGFMPLRNRDLSQAELQSIEDADRIGITVTKEGQELRVSLRDYA